MSALDELNEGARKLFLAHVGAVALGMEKSKNFVDELVEKGEITVEQGKKLDGELKHKLSDGKASVDSTILEERMKNMTDDERKAFVQQVNEFAKKAAAEASDSKESEK